MGARLASVVSSPLFTVAVLVQMVFSTPVSIAENPKINEWLTLVEKEMRVTLAKRLASAVAESAPFKQGTINLQDYMGWTDRYQVRPLPLWRREGLLATFFFRRGSWLHVLPRTFAVLTCTCRCSADGLLTGN